MTQIQTQTTIEIKTPKSVVSINLDDVSRLLQKLEYVTGCKVIERYISEFKTVEDIIAVLTDRDAWDEYRSTCAPSAQMFLVAITLMNEICAWSVVKDIGVPDDTCSKFYQSLGWFIAALDS